MSITSELERFKDAYKDDLFPLDPFTVELVEKAFRMGYMTGHKVAFDKGYERALSEGPHREDMGK